MAEQPKKTRKEIFQQEYERRLGTTHTASPVDTPMPYSRQRKVGNGTFWLWFSLIALVLVFLSFFGVRCWLMPLFGRCPRPSGETTGTEAQNNAGSASDNGQYGVFGPIFDAPHERLAEIFGSLIANDAVSKNQIYKPIADSIRLEYNDNDEINAFATKRKDDSSGEICRIIKFNAGAWNFARLVGCASAADSRRMALGEDSKCLERLVGLIGSIGRMPKEDAISILIDSGISAADLGDPSFMSGMEAISGGMVAGTLSHEIGHHVLGHLDSSDSTINDNLDISRNQEREADSFASTMINATIGENDSAATATFVGRLFWELFFAMKETAGVDDVPTRTHPLSVERLRNLLESNRTMVDSLGIDASGLMSLVSGDENMQPKAAVPVNP